MANRVGLIVTKVLRKMRQRGEHEVTEDELIAEMEAIQLELCRKYLALKVSGNIALVASTATYTLTGIYKLREVVPPSTWTKEFKIIHDTEEWAELSIATYQDTTQPQYGFIWNNVLNVIPVPTVTENLPYFGYGLPTASALVYTGDPETPQEFDDCYENELFFRETGDKVAHQLYLERAREISFENFKESVSGIIRVRHSSDELGF